MISIILDNGLGSVSQNSEAWHDASTGTEGKLISTLVGLSSTALISSAIQMVKAYTTGFGM